ncbi:hypothetical protein [Reichenbachiella ulvae]|uniref:Outer membrane protein beta-barrel domain-containing protein n=1 Tax=Reichenbachiella ulvae TaxID=2980104 RepID=A0ABT3CV45_9BACT|nr:hypothetical protein [Reichenbachiella ulvae]MCV9387543.1 hypothetical protein [Reichenbachiella ulvae]
MRITLFILLFFSTLQSALGQDSLQTKKEKELLTGLGSGFYQGDLETGLSNGQLLLTLGIKLNKNKRLNSNILLNFGMLQGNQLDYSFDDGSGTPTTPNESFNTDYFSINYELHFNIIHRERFQVYFSQGIGIMRFTPKDEEGNSLIDQPVSRPIGEDYRNLTIMLPSQIGLCYYLANDFGIGLQAGYFNTLTDYLDNLSSWGEKTGNDNVLFYRLNLNIPIRF